MQKTESNATLVERLRKLSAENKAPRDCIDEAADTIERLLEVETDLARLRKLRSGDAKEIKTFHGLLLWTLYHHQGGSSDIGQPIRRVLGIGQHDHLTPAQIAAAKDAAGLPQNVELTGLARLHAQGPATEGSEVERRVGGAVPPAPTFGEPND